jgi:hypothetical protein
MYAVFVFVLLRPKASANFTHSANVPNDQEYLLNDGGQTFSIAKFPKQIYKPNMNDATKRSILRWIHIIFGLPIIGYIYGPPKEVQPYAPGFSVCLRSGNCLFGILDVERPCRSANYFEKIGLIGDNASPDTEIKRKPL